MPETASGPGIRPLDQHRCFAVDQAGHAFNRVYRAALADVGLTYPQYLAMLVLWERDGVTVKELGERLALDSGTLTPLLKRLEAAGLVRRERCREDERRVLLHLTAAGDGLREKGRHVPTAIGCAIGQTYEQSARLLTELHLLRDALLASAASD